MGRTPEPDRQQILGSFSAEVIALWSELSKPQTQALGEMINGMRPRTTKDGKSANRWSMKFSGELRLNIGKDNQIRPFSSSGRRLTNEEGLQRFKKAKGKW